MSKFVYCFAILSAILLVGLVSAAPGSYSANINVNADDVKVDENASIVATINVGADSEISTTSGKYIINTNGDEVQISGGVKINGGQLQTFNGKIDSVKAELILKMTNVSLNLSNGKNASIKVMPSTASSTAIARLGLKVCGEENNCTIEFKETGKGEDMKPVYHVEAQKDAKILFLFKAKMKVSADVDVESGEVINSDKPWWAIIAKE